MFTVLSFNMFIQFIITILLLILGVCVKYFFFLNEPQYSQSTIAIIDIVLYLWGLMMVVILFIRNKPKLKFPTVKITIWEGALTFSIILILLLSFYITVGKASLSWDALALYDARAKFLEYGMTFSEMRILSDFDSLNSYYYLLYPPFTSILHYLWRMAGIVFPVSTMYSFFLSILAFFIFSFFKQKLGTIFALGGTLLVIANRDIFSVSVIEYTNIVFTTYIVAGIILLFQYIETKKTWMLIGGSILVATSQWIRFLEPLWFAVVLAWVVTLFMTKKLKSDWKPVVLLTIACLVQYLAWRHFTISVASNPEAIPFNMMALLDAIFGFFTGAFIHMSEHLFKEWGIMLVVYILSIIPLRQKITPGFIFLSGVIIFSIGIYVGGLYVLSVSYTWWQELTSSLSRSSTFLIPLATYLLLKKIRLMGKSKKV